MNGLPETTPEAEPSARSCACFNLRRASRAVSRYYDQWLRPAGLRTTQFSLLSALRERGPVSITELAGLLGLERTTLTRNLRPLEKQGLLRVSPEGFKRTRTVEITGDGERQWSEALVRWRQAQAGIDAHLGIDGSTTLRALLADLAGLDADET